MKASIKKELILDAMKELFQEGNAGTASVSDIAKKAGIAKGGLYYYFQSKEDVMDALIDREYEVNILHCKEVLASSRLNATAQFALLLSTYRSVYINPSMDQYLHAPQNAALHQKSLAQILISLSPIISDIISQGVAEGSYICAYPEEYAQFILAELTFLFDPGIFAWTPEQARQKMLALATFIEQALHAAPGSFSFLYAVN